MDLMFEQVFGHELVNILRIVKIMGHHIRCVGFELSSCGGLYEVSES